MRLLLVLLTSLAAAGPSPHASMPLSPPAQDRTARPHGFRFVRAEYGGALDWRRGAWATDFPKADLQFITVAQRLLPTLDIAPVEQVRRVFPELPIEELPADDPLFRAYYGIARIYQVPSIHNICRRGETSERDGYEPAVRGIRDADGRLMVLISWNSDLGDAWEWAEQPCYPLEFSTYAFQLGVNAIVYAMSR